MKKILLISHGQLSSGIVDSIKMIMGDASNLQTISVNPEDHRDTIKQSIAAFLDAFGEQDHLFIVTDILGGSVTNLCMEYLNDQRIHLICGMNLPLVLQLMIAEDDLPVHQIISESIEIGREGIDYVNRHLTKEITL
jgi:mannose/fructose-specific phosphotransferase system component IIA